MKQRKDYSGKIYGILHVKKWSEEKQAWLCKCECGNIKYCSSATLKKGKIKSCGCLSKQEIVGKKFGRLLVLNYPDRRKSVGDSRGGGDA